MCKARSEKKKEHEHGMEIERISQRKHVHRIWIQLMIHKLSQQPVSSLIHANMYNFLIAFHIHSANVFRLSASKDIKIDTNVSYRISLTLVANAKKNNFDSISIWMCFHARVGSLFGSLALSGCRLLYSFTENEWKLLLFVWRLRKKSVCVSVFR